MKWESGVGVSVRASVPIYPEDVDELVALGVGGVALDVDELKYGQEAEATNSGLASSTYPDAAELTKFVTMYEADTELSSV